MQKFESRQWNFKKSDENGEFQDVQPYFLDKSSSMLLLLKYLIGLF